MRRLRLLVAIAAVTSLLAAAAPSAQAGEVAFHFGDTLRFLPNPGEVNTVTLARSGPNYVVTDTTTPPTAGLNCTAVPPNAVSCPAADVESVSFDFGDLNDTGTVAASVVLSNNFNLFFQGGDGNDILNAGPGVNFGQYFGEDGNDTLNGSTNSDRLGGGDGNDTMLGGDGGDSLESDDGNDVLSGQAGDDRLDGGSSPGGNGADFLSGGPGEFDDLDYRRDVNMFLDANGVADDGENCPGAACEKDNVAADLERIDTGEGDDIVRAGGRPNVIFSSGGDDVVDGQGGSDRIFGGDGDDSLLGGAGGDEVQGQSGEDQHLGGPGDDKLRDTFGLEPDAFSGGAGLDLADFDGVDGPIRVDLDNQADDGRVGEGDNVRRDVEDVTGSESPDVIIGSKKANELSGGSGRDRLVGLGGADGLVGGAGGDLLVGGKASDLIDGGGGPDRLKARDRRRDEVQCGSARDVVTADRADRRAADCEKVRVS
jgi:Ca2+-binding RTX toxin-like protein